MSRLNLKHALRYRRKWPWTKFLGSQDCLHWNLKDLKNLEYALRYVRGRKLAVQAGGNLGLFPKRLAEDFKQVFTFEPDAALFDMMKRNAPERNIVMTRAALGCSRDPVALACHRRDGSGKVNHEGLTHVTGSGSIPQMLIDDLHLPACDLIYLDIEGFEFNALRGAVETIRKFKPVLGVEINANIAYYQSNKEELRAWITMQGYRKVLRVPGDDIFVPVKQ